MSLPRLLAALSVICLLAIPAQAQAPAAPLAAPIKVGVLRAPPFAFQDHDGQWTGLCIELWRHIATALKLHYELVPTQLATIYDDLAAGRFDVALGGLTPDSQNVLKADFTLPYMPSGLAIAVQPGDRPGFLQALVQMDTSGVFSFLGIIILCLVIVAVLVWWLERRRNPEHFGGSLWSGLSQSFWWSAVTMTTVGYGDLVPRSTWGRILAFGWMILSLILVSVFTGLVTSAMTVSQISAGISGPADLRHVAVGAIKGGEGAAYLTGHNIAFTPYPSSEASLKALATGRIDAVVGLAPELRFLTERDFRGQIAILPHLIQRRWVSFATRPGLPQARAIEQQLVRITETEMWNRVLAGFIGREH
ncbi:MAG: transporter substrate-binding domain-containing protein [Alphaproteobacteria bacterium]|jgi:ABC-type amino acid transport substrate-binding protein|nr:transporter substrate-binding domain-containing protein [Alphaproteobacteria bacterium]